MGYDKESWDKYEESYDDEEDGNTYLIYFYYLCYALGSIFYLQLSLICFWWSRQTRGRVPERVLAEDDDDIWQDWSKETDAGDIIESRDLYWIQSERYNILGAFAFTVMGLVELYMEWKRSHNILHHLMIPLGGIIGMINALGIGHVGMSALNATCYLLSCAQFNIFFAGAAIECIVAYGYLAGYDGDWLIYLDMAAALLWLYCAVKGAAAELFGISFTRLFHLRLDSLLKTERTAASSSLCCSPKSNVAQKRE